MEEIIPEFGSHMTALEAEGLVKSHEDGWMMAYYDSTSDSISPLNSGGKTISKQEVPYLHKILQEYNKNIGALPNSMLACATILTKDIAYIQQTEFFDATLGYIALLLGDSTVSNPTMKQRGQFKQLFKRIKDKVLFFKMLNEFLKSNEAYWPSKPLNIDKLFLVSKEVEAHVRAGTSASTKKRVRRRSTAHSNKDTEGFKSSSERGKKYVRRKAQK
ncbi:hypothetical protein [Flammeovirga agarivorans]|uniref:Uncharacterized protein n=1 Tax=Flammeovirga agarivorans TaxID=2726742 RepID=A0A7X8SR95_9BACT|nr:hypothetical protein [Flammeovirga agarivorans]NLR94935.1 hypothetical protein [Flammeovirga agarivorans]